MRTAAERRGEEEIRRELASERTELTKALGELLGRTRARRRAWGLVALTVAVTVLAVLRRRRRRAG